MKKSLLPPKPELRTVTISIKIKPSTAKALEKAVIENKATKAGIIQYLLEEWLRENGYLK